MVSVIFDVVSVWLVIEPCVKFGTTGTAWAGASVALAPTTDRTNQMTEVFMAHQSITVISVTNCPVALVPAPPAVRLMV